MNNYNLEDFKAWLEENNLPKFISITDYSHQTHRGFNNYVKKVISGEIKPGDAEYEKVILRWVSFQDLQRENQTLKDQTKAKKQRILALEADKQDLIQQLSQTKQKQQTYLSQEKAFLQKEIKLIKEALHD